MPEIITILSFPFCFAISSALLNNDFPNPRCWKLSSDFLPICAADENTWISLIKADVSVISSLKDWDGNLNLTNPNKTSFFKSSDAMKNSFPLDASYSSIVNSAFSNIIFSLFLLWNPTSLHLMHLHLMPFSLQVFSTYCLRFVLSTPPEVTYVGMSLCTLIIRTHFGKYLFASAIISAASFVVKGLNFPAFQSSYNLVPSITMHG